MAGRARWYRAAVAAAAMVGALVIASPVVAAPARKWSTPKAADAAGRKAFSEGRYAEAAEAFEAVYAMDPDPRMLANLGEVWRQAGECRRALAYFDRFLASPKSTAHPDIAVRAKGLRAKCPEAEAPAMAGPGGTPRHEGEPATAPGPAEPRMTAPPESEPGGPAVPTEPPAVEAPPSAEVEGAVRPTDDTGARWMVGLEGGVAFGSWGEAKSTSPAIRLTGGRVWRWGRFGLGVGLGAQWSTFGYESRPHAPTPYEARAHTLETITEIHGRVRLLPWLSARADAGAGLTWFSGFDAWNALHERGAAAGAGVAPTFRGALGAEVDLPIDGLLLRVTGIGMSLNTGADGVVGDLVQLQVGAGVGYRF